MKNKTYKRMNKHKSGFTLVELIVVIAILAVLAGIAIPAVITIINSASDSQIDTNASIMDQACKTYYTGVKSGAINRETFTPRKSSDEIPNRFVSTSKKNSCARNCTVAGALEYNGIYDDLINGLGDYGYDANGNIKPLGDPPDEDLTPLAEDGSDTFDTLNYAS